MIDFPPPPAPRAARAEPPAAAAPKSDVIRALVLQGTFEMMERGSR